MPHSFAFTLDEYKPKMNFLLTHLQGLHWYFFYLQLDVKKNSWMETLKNVDCKKVLRLTWGSFCRQRKGKREQLYELHLTRRRLKWSDQPGVSDLDRQTISGDWLASSQIHFTYSLRRKDSWSRTVSIFLSWMSTTAVFSPLGICFLCFLTTSSTELQH